MEFYVEYVHICIKQMMMYLEIQPIAFRCKFCMHVLIGKRHERKSKVGAQHKYLQVILL